MSLDALFLPLLFAYCLVSGRLERTPVTAPILFTLAGALAAWLVPHQGEGEGAVFLRLAEVGLVLLLFTDSSRTGLAMLRRIGSLPLRLLSVGMLLTIGLGMAAAKVVFPALTWWEAGILSSILAPTDAGLGMVIVNSPLVPSLVRQSLNVEAGLNDGLSVPFMLFFLAVARAGEGGTEASLMQFAIEQLGYGAALGVAVGWGGGFLIARARAAEWLAAPVQGLAVVSLPLLCILLCHPVGASAFIAAFVCGLAAQVPFPEVGRHAVEFTEEWGQVLSYLVFFLFGLKVAAAHDLLRADVLLYALLSLTVVRMLPVALSLLGTGLTSSTVAFMGWFGPRGLASIVLGLVYLEEQARLPGESTMAAAVRLTVLLSILAHGASAMPGIAWYRRKAAALPAGAPELACDA